MSTDVWVKVEDYERMLTAMEHEVVCIMFGIARDPAEDAPVLLRIRPGGDVLGTPGAPQSVQSNTSILFAA